MSEVEKLKKNIKELGITRLNVYPGTNTNVTKEEIAREINRSLERLQAGDYEEVKLDEED